MSSRDYDVVSIGSAVLDIVLRSSSFKLVKSKKFPGGTAICEAYEGKIEADEIVIASGGGGTNSAVSFARKGLKTAIITEMGDDVVGKMVSAELVKEKVDTDFVVIEEGEETGVSVIFISGEGGRSIVTYRGASRMLTHKDVPFDRLKTKWLYVSSLGGRISLLEEIARWADKNGVRVALNPGKREIRYRERLMGVIKNVDVLLLNQEEATLFSGDDYTKNKIFRSESCPVGPDICVITAGKKGGKVCSQGKCVFYEGSRLRKVSSLGTGDAFGSGFVAALIKGKSLEEATDWGKRNSESVLKYLSAKRGLLRLTEIK